MAKKKCCYKNNSISWAESKEAGPEAGQGRGKLVSFDWLTKSSPGDRLGLKVSRHLCITELANMYVCQGRRTNTYDKRKKNS